MSSPSPVTVRDTAATVNEFFTRFGAGDRPGMLELFGSNVDFNVPGSATVPWTGPRSTPAEIDEFLRIALEDITTERFGVARILVDGEHAVVLGAFAHRITSTGNLFASEFALHIQVVDGLIATYRMFEDSHGAAAAWQR